MKKALLIGLITNLAFLLAGCHNRVEEDFVPLCTASCTVIQGRLTTGDSTLPLAGVSLTLQYMHKFYLSPDLYRNKAKGTTDANGYYTMRFQMRPDEVDQGGFYVMTDLDKNRYLLNEFDLYPRPKRDTTLTYNYFLPYLATLIINVTNPSALQNNSSTIEAFVDYPITGKDHVYEHGPSNYFHVDSDPSAEFRVAAYVPMRVRVWRTINNLNTTLLDSTWVMTPSQQLAFPFQF